MIGEWAKNALDGLVVVFITVISLACVFAFLALSWLATVWLAVATARWMEWL